MSSIDQQFVEFIVKSLVGKPDAVSIERRIDEKGVLLELTVDPEDLGRVIGKRGATAQSLRTLLRALGTKNDARYNLKIVDNGIAPDRPPRPERDDKSAETPNNESASDEKPQQTEDKPTSDEPASNESKEATAEDIVASAEEEQETDHSDVVSKTRKELAEFDDLDV
jgi:predicted RNA-binding protein YlqC (UPF0109 family)